MEWVKIRSKIKAWLQKYKYPAIIVLVGILLMLLPNQSATKSQEDVTAVQEQQTKSVEQQLCEILSTIRGAGRVEVMLTEARGEQVVYQTDNDISEKNDESSTRTDTVLVTDENRAQNGLITQVVPPVYLGAIIVCQGGDDPTVKLAIIEAVSKVTGLRSDKISVLKMK